MTDKIDCRQLEFRQAGVGRVTVVLKANSGIAKGSGASKRTASHEGGPADGRRWEIGKQQDPCFDSRS